MNVKIETVQPFPSEIASKVVVKATALEDIFRKRGYNNVSVSTPKWWEFAIQATAKLRMYVDDPEKFDSDGAKRIKCEAIIMAFDPEQGIFPPNFNPQTGLYTQEG